MKAPKNRTLHFSNHRSILLSFLRCLGLTFVRPEQEDNDRNEDQRTHAEADKLRALYDLLGSDSGSV
jgi:hypothetical protein